MRILITGADGQLGCALRRVLPQHELVLGVWPQFDLLKPRDVEQCIQRVKPDLIIHAAAYTDVDGAEREPDAAFAVNADGTEVVARAASRGGARLLYISTDYVFDGEQATPYREEDQPNPINAYGRSKWEGECRALGFCPDTIVVRTSWLYGHEGRNFVKTIMRLAEERPVIDVVDDQRGSPTYAEDLAAALARLVELPVSAFERRTLHLAGSGDCTWYEFASAVVSSAGARSTIRPVPSATLDRPARRPRYSVLGNRALAEQGITLPHWKDALDRFIHEVGTGTPTSPSAGHRSQP